MTIEKRAEWGSTVQRTEVVSRHHDHELLGDSTCPQSGDMWLSVGSPHRSDVHHSVWRQLPIDHISVRLDDGEPLFAVAHVTAGVFWRGQFCITASTAFVRGKHLFHASHPNDGIIEFLVIDSRMTLRQRLTAMRRTTHGTHVPHPFILSTRGIQRTLRFQKPTLIRVDGNRVGRCTKLEVSSIPDAGVIYIPSSETTQEI